MKRKGPFDDFQPADISDAEMYEPELQNRIHEIEQQTKQCI